MNSVHWAFVALALITSSYIITTVWATGKPITEIPADVMSLITILLTYAIGRQVVKSATTIAGRQA